MTQALSITRSTEPATSDCGMTPALPPAGPLSSAHHAEIAHARQRRRTLNRASKIAAFNGWSFATLSVLSLPFALFSPSALIGGLALGGLAWNEFRGRRQLRSLDPLGPGTLGINQVIFCVLIALYCSYQIFNAVTGPGAYAEAIAQSPEVAAMLEPMQELMQTATVFAYTLMLVAGVALQGGTAWYYFSRNKHLKAYLQETPAWIVQLDRTAG